MCYALSMKYLGIDYGTKRIGLAVSDESGMIAFPREILAGGKQAFEKILDLVKSESIGTIVVGHSLNTSGERNLLMEDIDAFVEELHKLAGIPVELHDERFSSIAARAMDQEKSKANSRNNGSQMEHIDDRAAAIMLQRYLDRK